MSLDTYALDSTIHFKFTTRQFSTGTPFALAGGPKIISCYKDAGTTQDTGAVSLTVNFDSVTGLNHVAIDTSDAAAAASFYDTGAVIDVVLDGGTVDSVSVTGEVVYRFKLDHGANVHYIAGDTGIVGSLVRGFTDTGGSVRANIYEIRTDTGSAANLRQSLVDTGVITANLQKIKGDTGSAANLLQAILDTGVIQADIHKAHGDSGAIHVVSGRLLATDSGVLAAVLDTGKVSSAVWNTLRADHVVVASFGRDLADSGKVAAVLDTGKAAAAIWSNHTTRALTTFVHDTGVADTTWKSLTASYGDTGSFGEELGQGVNVVKFAGDTGPAVNLAQALQDTGVIQADIMKIKGDTGSAANLLQSILDTGVMQADVIKFVGDTGAPTRIDRAGRTEVLGVCAALGNTTTVIASALSPTSAVNDQFKGRIVIFDKDTTTAALRGQASDITAYTHATLTFTVTALTSSPAENDTFVVV